VRVERYSLSLHLWAISWQYHHSMSKADSDR
jgi:hypothetical protein